MSSSPEGKDWDCYKEQYPPGQVGMQKKFAIIHVCGVLIISYRVSTLASEFAMKRFVLLASFLMGSHVLAAEAPKSELTYKVSGMSCGACEGKVKNALTGIDGVTVTSVSAKDGAAAVEFDAAKVKPAQVQAAITDAGFKVEGQVVSIAVEGMSCGACSSKVAKALEAASGVTDAAVSHADGKATITIDPAKTDKAKLAEVINGTGFKAKS
jgi:copper ion binding protein